MISSSWDEEALASASVGPTLEGGRRVWQLAIPMTLSRVAVPILGLGLVVRQYGLICPCAVPSRLVSI